MPRGIRSSLSLSAGVLLHYLTFARALSPLADERARGWEERDGDIAAGDDYYCVLVPECFCTEYKYELVCWEHPSTSRAAAVCAVSGRRR